MVSSLRRISRLAGLFICMLLIGRTTSAADDGLIDALALAAPAAERSVIALAIDAFGCANAADARTLSVIDYSRPSTEPRLWVFDLEEQTLLFEEWVAHGQNTGGNLAVQFSNRPGSHMSSLGAFLTADAYVGRNGYSLRLHGLEPGFNDRAYERAIVIHGAPYVDAGFAADHGRLGRSHGCPAVRTAIARRLIDTIRGGSFVFAYYPDDEWLRRSPLLGACDSQDGRNLPGRAGALSVSAAVPSSAH